MAKTAKAKKVVKKPAPMKPWMKVLALIMLFPFAALLLPTTLVFAAMMAPTWVAYITDRSREKHLAITVGLLNFSGTLPAIIDLWSRGQSHNAAMAQLADVFVWAVAYGAAMIGWILFAIMPSLVGSYFKITTDNRIKNLAERQKALIDEWGHAVAGNAGGTGDEQAEEDEDAALDDGSAEVTEAELVQPAQAH